MLLFFPMSLYSFPHNAVEQSSLFFYGELVYVVTVVCSYCILFSLRLSFLFGARLGNLVIGPLYLCVDGSL